MFNCVVTDIDQISLPIKVIKCETILSQCHHHNLLFHDAPDGPFSNSFLVYHSIPASFVSLPKFYIHCFSSASQPTAQLF